MRIPRLYLNPPLLANGEIQLDEARSHYLSRVLRLESGRPLTVFDGEGQEAGAVVYLAGKKSVTLRIDADVRQVARESPLPTHLAVGISRGERMDFVLQKATELGVTQITPLWTERTEVKLKGERLQKKQAHWQQIIISACEQCQRNRLPRLEPATDLHDFLTAGKQPGLALILHHRSAQTLKQLTPPTAVTLLIGPEGGLADTEIQRALDQQFLPLTLGPRVLRTETAPIAALSAVQLLWGDLG